MMHWRVFILALIVSTICFQFQPMADAATGGSPQVYVNIDGNLNPETVAPLRDAGFDGVMFTAVQVTYDGAGGWTPDMTNLAAFGPGDLDGLGVHLVAKLSLWDAGWEGNPQLILMASFMTDMMRTAIGQTEAAGGVVTGISLTSPDANPDIADLAQVINWMRNNPALSGMILNFGLRTDAGTFAGQDFSQAVRNLDFAVVKIRDASKMNDVITRSDSYDIPTLVMIPGGSQVGGPIDSGNYIGVVLDGIPEDPAEYVKPADAPAKQEPETVVQTPPTEEQMAEDRRTFNKAFWMVGLLALIGCSIAGLTVWRKKNLEYDEESGEFKRKGGNSD